MEYHGMLLLIHGELSYDRTLVTEREEAFLPTLFYLTGQFPRLRIVLEHVSTKAGVESVKDAGSNVAATITAHHLCLTLNDLIGHGIQPHNVCMPVPKGFYDRDALIRGGNRRKREVLSRLRQRAGTRERIRNAREGRAACTPPPFFRRCLPRCLTARGALDRLEDFTSRFGAEFYGLPLNKGTIELREEEWTVPDQIGSVVPFHAGKVLKWRLA